MSTKCSLAYVGYNKGKGTLHIFFEMMDCKHYIEDDGGGRVELPEHIAKEFVTVLKKYDKGG